MQAQRIASRPWSSAASRPPLAIPRRDVTHRQGLRALWPAASGTRRTRSASTPSRRPTQPRGSALLLLATVLLLGGCDGELARGVLYPDVRLTYRQSLMEETYVVRITNAAAKPLFDVAVSCQRWNDRYILTSTLRPGDTVEAGWIELPSGFRSGDAVEVTAEGFPLPYTASIP